MGRWEGAAENITEERYRGLAVGRESRLWAAEMSFQVEKHEGKAWTSRTQEKFSKGGDSFPSCLLSVPEFQLLPERRVIPSIF